MIEKSLLHINPSPHSKSISARHGEINSGLWTRESGLSNPKKKEDGMAKKKRKGAKKSSKKTTKRRGISASTIKKSAKKIKRVKKTKRIKAMKKPETEKKLTKKLTKKTYTKKSKVKSKSKGKKRIMDKKVVTIRVPGKTQRIRVPMKPQVIRVPGKTQVVRVPGKTQIVKLRVNPTRKQNALVKTGATIGAIIVTRGIGNLLRMAVLRLSLPAGKSINDANEAVKTPEGTKAFLQSYAANESVRKFVFNYADLISQGGAFVLATVPLTAKPIKKMIKGIPMVNMTIPYFTAGAGLNVALSAVSKIMKTNQINKLGTIINENVPRLGTMVKGNFPLGRPGINAMIKNAKGQVPNLGTIVKGGTPGSKTGNGGEWDPDDRD